MSHRAEELRIKHEQQSSETRILEEHAKNLRAQQEQQSFETRRLEGGQYNLGQQLNAQLSDHRTIMAEMQNAWQVYADLRGKVEESNSGRDDRGLGASGKELPTVAQELRRESCPPIIETETNSKNERALAINPTIRSPPKFTAEHYQRWKEELSFWREIHSFASDNTLIAELALGSSDILRAILVIFLRDTRDKKEERTFGNSLMILDKEFQKGTAERALSRMAAFNNFQRLSNESIRSFWIRYQKMVGGALSGLDIANKVSYVRALQALNLNENQRMSVLAATNQMADQFDPVALEDVSTRLLSAAFKIENVSDTLLADTEDDEGYGESGTYDVAGKGRNRPGLEKSAVRITTQGVNFPNKGKSTSLKGTGGTSLYVTAAAVLNISPESAIFLLRRYRHSRHHLSRRIKEESRSF